MSRRLRMGMVGGGAGAFIGAVHRHAAALDGQIDLVAGALSSTPEKARASGRALGLPEDRTYGSWEEMLERELSREDRIDFVSVVTPNHMHYPVARAFAAAGIHVISDKPLVTSSEQAADLMRVVAETGVVFAVTYNYTGYPMVRQARQMVRSGQLGELRKVTVEYHQGWLAEEQDEATNKQAGWRTDPARSGLGGAIGDIGSHAENLISTVTGLELEAVCADLTAFVPGRRLDDDASVLLRFRGGARGLLTVSQVEIGAENDLRLRVHGTRGSLLWRQEDPNHLTYDTLGGPRQVLTRGGPGLSEEAQRATRLPAGHPEGFLEAFANVYLGAAAHIRAGLEGQGHTPDYPTVEDGARGVHFIERVVESSRGGEKWTDAVWTGGQGQMATTRQE
ncbi:Gfo/Idh/MocA family oxidoreductase [Deinococcus sp. YIM 134068]|uniref:Gfo/Idh/MocA family protein n=1 Tax=Deinococcus lichenicola TaxID=3118910 RepID=UPI002F93DB89